MEAKEKAEKLYMNYMGFQFIGIGQYLLNNYQAKLCALIVVKEILELGLHDIGNYKDFKGIPCEWYISYWKEVEQEIKKL